MAEVANYHYDESRWPILRVIAPPARASDAAFKALVERMASTLRRRQPFVVVFELAPISSLSVERRDLIRRHMDENHELVVAYQRGMAIVVHSAFQRAIVAAVSWANRSSTPTKVFSDLDSALAWARERLNDDDTAHATAV